VEARIAGGRGGDWTGGSSESQGTTGGGGVGWLSAPEERRTRSPPLLARAKWPDCPCALDGGAAGFIFSGATSPGGAGRLGLAWLAKRWWSKCRASAAAGGRGTGARPQPNHTDLPTQLTSGGAVPREVHGSIWAGGHTGTGERWAVCSARVSRAVVLAYPRPGRARDGRVDSSPRKYVCLLRCNPRRWTQR
jgi:hypothetical protein